ncbi:MAG: 30S ribosomal protein S2 [Planctomycetes bacterium]|nr:30S ribosomal protein S2 [Planctomycetota bacterium]
MPEASVSPEELLKAGVHFGHRVSRWNPKMAPYIYDRRNQIHIIDVKQTLKGLVKAYHFLEKLAARNELILFVGTKRQAGPVIKAEAKRCVMPYVAERWIGGTLTNYATVRERLKRLEEIETWEKDGTIHRYGKKEQAAIQREKRKLVRNLDGLRQMQRLPAALVVVDPAHEGIAVQEADKIGAATIALIDTDGDPETIDVAIPGNDDSMKVVQLIIGKLADAVVEGKAHAEPVVAKPEPVLPVVVTAGGRDRDRRDRRPGGPGGRGRGDRGMRRDAAPASSAGPAPATPAPAAPQP